MKTLDRVNRTTEAEFLFHLRVGVLAISSVLLLSVLLATIWLRDITIYRPLWMQVVAYGALVGIAAAEGVLMMYRRPWGNARWTGIALAFAASILSCLSLPAGYPTTASDWAFGTVGWAGVILLLEQPVAQLVGFLAVHEAITAVNLMLSGATDQGSMLNFVTGSIGTIGFPLACGLAATALRDAAAKAEAARRQAEDIRHAERVRAETEKALQDKYAESVRAAGRLLQGLAEGSLDKDDPEVQQDCWIGAAQLRRHFTENGEIPNQLVDDLRQDVDTAERRKVKAEIAAYGKAINPPPEIRKVLTDIPLLALASAKSQAKVTVISTPDLVSVNVVSDCGRIELPTPTGVPVEVESIWDGNTLWVEARWRTGRSQS